jgi:hypothetical protein
MSAEVIEGSESPIQGWYSEDHHKKCSSPVLSFTIDKARTEFVAWVMYPLPAGAEANEVRASMEHEPEPGCTAIQVQRGELSDYVRLPDRATAGRDEDRARLARISLQRPRKILAFRRA